MSTPTATPLRGSTKRGGAKKTTKSPDEVVEELINTCTSAPTEKERTVALDELRNTFMCGLRPIISKTLINQTISKAKNDIHRSPRGKALASAKSLPLLPSVTL
jgi:hypothetical protein